MASLIVFTGKENEGRQEEKIDKSPVYSILLAIP